MQEIPTSTLNTSGSGSIYSGGGEQLSALPGSELEHPLHREGSEFINGFHAANDHSHRFGDIWDGIQNPHLHGREGQANFHPRLQPELNGK